MPFLRELKDAGAWLGAWSANPELRGACGAVAAHLRQARVRFIGLVPSDDAVAVPAVAVLLGRALADQTTGPVAVLDARGSWARAGAAPATAWLADRLAVVAAPQARGATALENLVAVREADTWERVLVDLTGFERGGDELAACEILDGIVLVARSGRTSRRSVERWARALAGVSFLGVLLSGA